MVQIVEASTPGTVKIVSPTPVTFSFEVNEVAAAIDVLSETEANVSTTDWFGKAVVKASSVTYPGRYGKVEINFLIPLTMTVL